MAWSDDLPISESLAVFLGISGFQWLTEGRASVHESLLPALAAGALIYLARRLRERRRQRSKD